MKEKEYIGNRDQLFNIKRYMYSDGKRKNVEAIELQNSNGLDVTILVDKCLDIYQPKNIKVKFKFYNTYWNSKSIFL